MRRLLLMFQMTSRRLTGTWMIMRITLFSLIVVLVGAVFFGSGCVNRMARDKAEREIEKMLPEALGPAENYDVQVEGSASALMKGRLNNVRIHGTKVQAKDLPLLESLEANVADLHVDVDSFAVVSSGPAAWAGTVSGAELTRLVDGKVPLVDDLVVEVEDGGLVLSGRAGYGRVGARGSVQVRPEIRGGDEIWLVPLRVDTLGVGAGVPVWAQTRLADALNPVYRIPENPLGIRVESVSVSDGLLQLKGTFDPKGLAAAARKRGG